MKLTTKFWKMGMTAVLFGGGLFLISQGNAVYAENGISIEESFSDPAFRAYVSDNLDTVKDGVLSAEEADAVTFIDVNCQGVKDLTGIEYFQNLTHLECVGSDKGRLTTLDISKNSKLEILYCVDNDLTEVNISENPSLRELALDTNPMKTLDIRKNPGLKLAVSKGAFISADEVGGHALYDGDEYYYYTDDEETDEVTNYYLNVDPSVLIIDRTGWEEFKDNWYFISEEGKTCVGWKQIGKNWFYFNNSGVMQTGWLKNGEKCYFLNDSGAMQTGWQQIEGKWYYFRPDGTLFKGWLKYGQDEQEWVDQGNGSAYLVTVKYADWYYLDENGVMKTGWFRDGGRWYYFDPSGKMHTGWLNNNGKKYYFQDENAYSFSTNDKERRRGEMVTGILRFQKSEDEYYFDPKNGAMLTSGWAYLSTQSYGSFWVYAKENGKLQNGWLKDKGKWYYFQNDMIGYVMVTGFKTINDKCYFFDWDSGAMKSGCWLNTEMYGKRYKWAYADTSGALVNGWKKISGKWYYFDPIWEEMGQKGYIGYMATDEYIQGYRINADGTWTYQPKASWHKTAKGWWYGDSTGWYAKNRGYQIDGEMYIFDQNGYVTNGVGADKKTAQKNEDDALFRQWKSGDKYMYGLNQVYHPEFNTNEERLLAVVETKGRYYVFLACAGGPWMVRGYFLQSDSLDSLLDELYGKDLEEVMKWQGDWGRSALWNVQKDSKIYIYSKDRKLLETLDYTELSKRTYITEE